MPTTKRTAAGALPVGILAALVGAATAAEPEAGAGFTLHGATAKGEVQELRLQVSGEAKQQRLTVFRGEDAPTRVHLHLTTFRGPKGAVDVGLQASEPSPGERPEGGTSAGAQAQAAKPAEAEGAQAEAATPAGAESGKAEGAEPAREKTEVATAPFSLDLPVEGSTFDFDLVFPTLEEGTELEGTLSVEAADAKPPVTQQWQIVLARRGTWLTGLRQLLSAHTLVLAVVMLLLGILVSVWSETWLDQRRKSHAVQARIARVRPIWLKAEPPWPPVVRVKALLKQAEDRSREAWLAGTRVIEERIDQAEELLKLLRRARNVRIGFQETPMPRHPWLVRFRARAILRRIMRNIGMEALDPQSTDRFRNELKELEGWLDPKKLPERYSQSVSQSIDQLLMEVRLEGFQDEEHKKLVRGLIHRLEEERKGLVPSTEGRGAFDPARFPWTHTLRTVEAFAALKLLWERRDDPEYEELIECCHRKAEVQDFFDVADLAAWKRLREASTAGELEIRTPQTTGDEIEAFEPIRFEVHSGKRALDMTHLFHYELSWDWRIEVEPKHRKWFPWRRKKILRPRSTEPQVIQYAPIAGTLSASVRITFDRAALEDREIDVKLDEPLRIVPSETFRRLRLVTGTEGAATAVAAVVALAVGLRAEYVDNPAFERGEPGTLAAYITLSLWGVGADKAKSFLAKLPSHAAEDEPAARPSAQEANEEATGGSPGQH